MNANVSTDQTWLDPGLHLRALTWSDAEAVAQLMYDVCAAEGDAILAESAEELRYEWQTPGFNLETDAFVVETTDRRIVGYADITNSDEPGVLTMNGNAHPNFKGRGIGTTLLRAMEQRAREITAQAEPGLRAAIKTTINQHEPDGIALHENEGYRPIKYHWRMEIVLDGPPASPKLPEGIVIHPFLKGEQDVPVWEAQNEAFGNKWDLEEWRRYRFDDPEFDPTLWAIAWNGDQVAGFSMNRYRTGIGWIRTLGVRPAWRKRGLGQALLLHSFGEYYRRGMRTIGLGVDAHNPTGATRLYQRVGMHPASEHVTYEKELRPGRELSVQSLS